MIRATFLLEPPGSADALAVVESTGMEPGPDFVRGQVVSHEGGLAVIDFPAANWDANIPLLVSTLIAGEVTEMSTFSRCRLVDLRLPDGLLPGPAFGADPTVIVGVIVKPSLGLSPSEIAVVVRRATEAGAGFIKDDEILGDPAWCPLEARVRAVARVLPPDVTYCANVTGPSASLIDRARRVVEWGATGVMVNAVAQGLDSVLALRQADLNVPILVHRAGSGPWCRNPDFGLTGAVLTGLFRLCGADFVIVGAFGGKLFETQQEVLANLAAARDPQPGVKPSWALLGGGIGPDNAARQTASAGGKGLVLLLGSRAYAGPEGIGGSVRKVVEALA